MAVVGKARACRAAGRMAEVKTRLSMVVIGGVGGSGGCACLGVGGSVRSGTYNRQGEEERGGRRGRGKK